MAPVRKPGDVADGTLSRRTVIGLAAAAGLLGPAAVGWPGRLLGAEEPSGPGPSPTPPSTDPLARGLFALSRPHRTWVEGHAGAAVIASHYFAKDNDLDERTSAALRANVDAFMAASPDEFPAPNPGPGTADPARIVEELDRHVHELRSGGHDAIYGALALRALRDRPELATPSVVDGICRLLQQHVGAYRPVKPSPHALEHPWPAIGGPKDLAAVTLRATLRPWSHVRAMGASRVIHWMTHAEALVSLEELGYAEVARHGHAALQVNANQPVEDDGDATPEHPPLDWLGPAYWESDAPRRVFEGSWLGGHSFKLPHSLFRLLRHVDDPKLRSAALTRGADLLVPFEPVGRGRRP